MQQTTIVSQTPAFLFHSFYTTGILCSPCVQKWVWHPHPVVRYFGVSAEWAAFILSSTSPTAFEAEKDPWNTQEFNGTSGADTSE
jgi:hypothetical protein